MAANIATIVATVGGFGLIAGLVYAAKVGNGDREAEEAARVYFDQHGRWPDDED
jgi:hypothetical protein